MERDNGLEAQSFVFLGTVDRQVAEELLTDLGDEGIAAYLAAVERDEEPDDERVYVDEESVQYARALLRHTLTGGRDEATDDEAADDEPTADQTDVPSDETWARLVASYHRPADDTDRPWSEAEEVDGEESTDDEATQDRKDREDRDGDRSRRARPRVSVVRLDADEPADETDDDEHYVRPEPPKLPRGDVLTKAAWAVMFLALAYPIAAVVLDWPLPGWLIALAVVVFIAGVVVHVVRIRDPESGGDADDGAVV